MRKADSKGKKLDFIARLLKFPLICLAALSFFFLIANGSGLAETSPEFEKKQKFKKAIKSLMDRRLSVSQKLFEELVQSYPRDALVHYNLGNVYYLQEKYSKAIKSFKKVVELDSPLKYPSRLFLSKTYRQLKRLKIAFNYIQKLKQERLPKNLAASVRAERAELQKTIMRVGVDLYKKQKYKKALQAFNLALELEFDDHALMFKAMTLKKMKREKEAEQYFTQVYRTTSDPALRRNAQILLEKPVFKPSRKKWWLIAEAAGGYNSNVFADGAE
nr:tetratricopeptide repeat protein [Candidatus Saccharibacteria bacterium]NIV04394.1 tetratricopeptide repeat protein [Calditrichia bacterium]NIW80231.1 tetratricopeptide repeat protein [Calditrichia bacterium]